MKSRSVRDVCLFLAGWFLAGMLGSSAPQQPTSIPFTELEKLQAEVVLLKAAAAETKSRPLQIEYQALVATQRGYYEQLRMLGVEILRARGLDPKEWTPSWDTLTIEKVPAPTPKPAL